MPMIFSRKKWSKILLPLAFFAFMGVLADIHADEYSSKQSKSNGQADTCCVTCCPAHNLAPSTCLVISQRVERRQWNFVPEVSFHSEKIIVGVFHPPRLAV